MNQYCIVVYKLYNNIKKKKNNGKWYVLYRYTTILYFNKYNIIYIKSDNTNNDCGLIKYNNYLPE
jgi:hypothetical protein